MIQEPLIPVRGDKMNHHSYVSSCSEDEEEEEEEDEAVSSSATSVLSSSALPCTAATSTNATSTSTMAISSTSSTDPALTQQNQRRIMSRSTTTTTTACADPVRSVSPPTSTSHTLTCQDGQNNQERKTHESIEKESSGSNLCNSRMEDSPDVLQSRILSLEEQLKSLTLLMESLQRQQQEQHEQQQQQQQHKLQSQKQACFGNGNASVSRSLSPLPWNQSTTIHDLLDAESPPLPKQEPSKFLSLSLPDDDKSNGNDHVYLENTPDLEYRSYTPNYEKELWNIRKTSRGMSLDQNEVSSGGGGDGISGGCGGGNMVKSGSKNSSRCNMGGNENGSKDVDPGSTIKVSFHDVDPNDSGNTKNRIDGSVVTMDNEQPRHEMTSNSDIIPSGGGDMIVTNRSAEKIHGQESNREKGDTISAPTSLPSPSISALSTRLRSGTTLRQMEEKMNTNAVLDFIRGLNIDSRQQDGSASEDVDANMEEFLRVPFRIENLLFFGLAICFDSFLNVLTVTPLKFVWSCLCLVCTMVRPGKGVGVCKFHRRHLYQLLRVFVIWFVYHYVLCPISLGRLYHWIRGQAMLKLYVLMAMVEVFDRLMCSFGQDALDSLYWNTTRRPYHPRMIASTIVVLVYATVHSLILFVHAATLNVAMNSADSALMSLLIGGNFAEIKSTVFKKYNKQHLFKITTSDICERFKLVLFLGLVLLLNCTQGGMNQEMVNDYIYMSFIIMGAEMVCDWIKHSFITKFNFIKSSVYLDYSLVLAGDITGIGHETMHIEHTHAVVKRLGFAQIPLICVMLRYLREASRYAGTLTHNGDSNHVLYSFAVVWTNGSWRMITNYALSFFICLLGLKFLLGYAITRKARSIIFYGPLEGQVDSESKRRQAV